MENEQIEVIFLDDDKLTVLDRQFVKYGDSVKYKGEQPEKAPTLEGTYTFEGWSDEEKMECDTKRLILIAMYKIEKKSSNFFGIFSIYFSFIWWII